MAHGSLSPGKPCGRGTPRRFLNPQDGFWYVQITQGESHVSGNPREILTTVLGSCIAACIRDPHAGVGGMNHFLLPEGGGADRDAARFGVNAMELLINGLLKAGAMRNRLEAKLFGGANVIAGLSDVGSRNARFARKFLGDEAIALVGGDVGGQHPRRIQFWPSSGRARQIAMPVGEGRRVVESELAQSANTSNRQLQEASDVELF